MGDFAIGIPWRPGNAHREASHRHVTCELGRLFPDTLIVHADSGHRPFSRAASRNAIMRMLSGFDAVMICDADTIPEPEAAMTAVRAAGDGALHLPYTVFRPYDEETTLAILAGADLDPEPPDEGPTNSTGGVIVMNPGAWFACGGMDERFTGWGFEDAALPFAVTVLGAGMLRHKGIIRHLWHPTAIDRTDPAHERAIALCERYQDAHDPEAMRALVNEHLELKGHPTL